MGHKYIAKLRSNGRMRYFYTQEELAAYRKALSSKDELDIASKKANRYVDALKSEKKVQKENAYDANLRLFGEKKKTAQRNINQAKLRSERAKNERDKAINDYERATTIKGKAEDVKKVFNKYHPDTVRKVNKAKKKIEELFS